MLSVIIVKESIAPKGGQVRLDILCMDNEHGQFWMGFHACELLNFEHARKFDAGTSVAKTMEMMGGTGVRNLAEL